MLYVKWIMIQVLQQVSESCEGGMQMADVWETLN